MKKKIAFSDALGKEFRGIHYLSHGQAIISFGNDEFCVLGIAYDQYDDGDDLILEQDLDFEEKIGRAHV